MPVTMSKMGEEVCIKKITGKVETRRFLENLGFISGTKIKVVSALGGNLIIHVKESRIALSKDMANRILVA